MTCLFIARVIDREEIEKEKREKEVGDLKSELMSHTEKQIDRVSSLLTNNAQNFNASSVTPIKTYV